MSEKLKQVLVDITIAAPIDAVWSALRDPAQIKDWFGWDAPSLADEIKYIFADTATGDDTTHVLQFDEWEGEGISERVELTAVAGGTRLRLVRSGGAPIDWTGVYEDISQGWITFFQQLRLALEKHAGEGRRTIYLSGPSRQGIGEPSADLGLGATSALAEGAAYAADLAVGERASGEVCSRRISRRR